MQKSLVAVVAAITVAAGIAVPASAALPLVSTPVTLLSTDIGSTFGFTFNGYVDENLQSGLSAKAIFKLNSVSADKLTWSFGIEELSNTSGGPITGSRISLFAFNADPDVSGSSAAGLFSQLGYNAVVPQFGGANPFDVCFRAGGGGTGCSSGGGGGVDQGDTYSGGSFILTFANAVNSLKLDNFVVRYQSIDGSQFGDSGVGAVSAVPEPGSWAMMIAGFGLAGAAMRRKRALATA